MQASSRQADNHADMHADKAEQRCFYIKFIVSSPCQTKLRWGIPSIISISKSIVFFTTALAYNFLGSRARSEPVIAARHVGSPPHLFVVGTGNSLDPGPARLRKEANQGARRRRWRRHRWRDCTATAVSCVFFNTPPGLKVTRIQK